MSVIFNKMIFLVIYLSIVFASALRKRQPKTDDMCGIIRNVLCVKQVLNETAANAKNVSQTAHKIEKQIVDGHHKNRDSFNNFIKIDLDSIRPKLPLSTYHEQFFNENNINREDLVHLLLEAHYAVNFYYNSLQEILDINDIYAVDINRQLEELQKNTIKEIICQFRNVLHVYTTKWQSTNQINRIQFSPRKDRGAPSTVGHAHSVVLLRLLQNWMKKIHSIIDNLEMKYV